MADITKDQIFDRSSYHFSYHEREPLNCNGPYQYSSEQLEQMAEIRRANEIIKFTMGGTIVRNPTINSKITYIEGIDPISEDSKVALIKVESISKEEFKQSEHESIMAEWKELIGQAEIELIPFELEY